MVYGEGSEMQKGDRVRFTVGPLGLLAERDLGRFGAGIVQKGDEGVYDGPHPSPRMDDWHLVQVGDCWAPVHSHMIEPA